MSTPAPRCRRCGKAIAKETRTFWVRLEGEGGTRAGPDTFTVPERLRSIQECRRLTNHTVVSVKYFDKYDYQADKVVDRYVSSFNTWDGESYRDPFFCNGECARLFAYVMAKAGHCTQAYAQAVGRLQKEEAA